MGSGGCLSVAMISFAASHTEGSHTCTGHAKEHTTATESALSVLLWDAGLASLLAQVHGSLHPIRGGIQIVFVDVRGILYLLVDSIQTTQKRRVFERLDKLLVGSAKRVN